MSTRLTSARDRVRMDDAEVAALLAEHTKVQVASLGADGAPHLTTLFYALRHGKVAFWTYARSQKAVNLARDARLSALVEDGTEYAELRGVSIRGQGEVVADPDVVREVGAAVAVRMTGVERFEDLGELGRDAVEAQVPKRVAVIVHPNHVASWDHRKLGGG